MPGKVIVVDDDPILLRVSARILRAAGYEVAEAPGGEAALSLARAWRPDLMLVDVHMPGMDGLEVCRRLKADPSTSHILVVMLSSTAVESNHQAEGLELGADDYLVRPLPNRELLARVRAMLRIRQAERVLSAQLRQQAGVARLGQVALSGLALPALLREAMALTAETLDAASCTVMELSPNGSCLTVKAATDEIAGAFSVPAGAESQAGYTLLAGQPVVSEDLAGETRFSAARDAQAGYASAASVVMPGRERDYGVLLIRTLRRRAFSQDDLNFLQTVANVLSTAIQRDQDQAAVRQLATKLRAVAQVSQEITRLRDPEQMPHQHVIGLLREMTGAYHAGLFLQRGEFLELLSAHGGGPGVEKLLGQRFDPAHGLVGHAARTGQPILASDVRADPRYLAPDLLPDTRCELAVPIKSEGRVLGVLDLQSTEVGGLDHADLEALGILADQMAVVMENAMMFRQARLRAREMEALSRVSSALREASGASEIAQLAADQLMALLGADGLLVAQSRPAGDGHLVTASRGAWEQAAGSVIKAGQGMLGEGLAAAKPLLAESIAEQECGLRGNSPGAARHALACAPLGSHGRSLGALAVRRERPFSDSDANLLSAVADIAANAIQRAMSYERMEQSLKQAQATHEISIAITASMEAHLSLGFVLKHVLSHLGADAACVLKLKAGARAFEFVAGRGFRARSVEQARLRMSLGPLSQATLERRLVNIAALETEPAYAQAHALHGEELACATIAPLIAKGRVNGVLEIFYRAATQLTPSQLSFLDAVTTQAALALDNAELFAGLQQSNIELSLAYQATLEGWARALQLRDPLTETHSMQTVELTVRLARMIGIEEQGLIHVRRGAILHDIGKLGVPDNILRKPGPLTPEEWEIMRLHPQHARDLLMPIEYLRPAIDIPYCHHERWDGSGYPRGLRGVEIPLAARVFAVVDVWDALRYNRPYRPGWSGEQVKQFLIAQKGIAFDPHAVDVFVRSIDSEASDAPPAGLAGGVFLSDRD